jgi:hypothetical protein
MEGRKEGRVLILVTGAGQLMMMMIERNRETKKKKDNVLRK